jgi:hypothetical protein
MNSHHLYHMGPDLASVLHAIQQKIIYCVHPRDGFQLVWPFFDCVGSFHILLPGIHSQAVRSTDRISLAYLGSPHHKRGPSIMMALCTGPFNDFLGFTLIIPRFSTCCICRYFWDANGLSHLPYSDNNFILLSTRT